MSYYLSASLICLVALMLTTPDRRLPKLWPHIVGDLAVSFLLGWIVWPLAVIDCYRKARDNGGL